MGIKLLRNQNLLNMLAWMTHVTHVNEETSNSVKRAHTHMKGKFIFFLGAKAPLGIDSVRKEGSKEGRK